MQYKEIQIRNQLVFKETTSNYLDFKSTWSKRELLRKTLTISLGGS